ncbi:hypothetical protein [Synechocystis sp. LKSZ1]|uniref:hypothetical protein n=1 Tax=Synechocystis sp. LKSZ1 TaxID=3144951 RepID=UPI00336C1C8B
MFLFVICFNLCLALFNCYLAVRFWLWRRSLRRLTKRLKRLDRCAHGIFGPAPAHLYTARQGLDCLRQRYHLLVRQWLFLQRVLQVGQWLITIAWRQPYSAQLSPNSFLGPKTAIKMQTLPLVRS